MVKWLIKIVIFSALWFVRAKFFSPEQGGPLTGLLYLGETVTNTNLASDGGGVVMTIFSFIITVAVYYIISELITVFIMIIFKANKKEK
jgi:hypothetical protein